MTDKTIQLIGRLVIVIGILPILAINLSYIIAVAAGKVPSCFPYIDGCTSISSTGRKPPSSFVFKPSLYLTAVLMIWFWLKTDTWLSMLGEQSMFFRRQLKIVGIIGAIALMVYVYFLGTEGAIYRLMRQYGVTFYFGLTYLAQLMLAGRIYRLANQDGNLELIKISRLMLYLCFLLLVLGLFSIPVTNFFDSDELKMIIEWNFSLLLQIYFFLAYVACRFSRVVMK